MRPLLERLTEPGVLRVVEAVFAGAESQVPVDGDYGRRWRDPGLAVKYDEDLSPDDEKRDEATSRFMTDGKRCQLDGALWGYAPWPRQMTG
jgi:hypothetical protein